jgi:hypothetical protein
VAAGVAVKRPPAVAAAAPAAYISGMPDPKGDAAAPAGDTAPDPEIDLVQYSNQSIHQIVQQQISELLADADLSEEDRQRILIAMSCPCCGTGGLSLSIELKPKPSPARF